MLYAILLMGLFLAQFLNPEEPKELSEEVIKIGIVQEICPDAKILWGKEFKGRMLDLKIAKKSGHVAVATVDDDTKEGIVYYFASDGEILWEKNNFVYTDLTTIYDCNIEMANDGSKVMIHWAGDYESIQIYNTEGNLLFDQSRGVAFGFVQQLFSPNGQYFFEGKWYKTPMIAVKGEEYLKEPVNFFNISYFQNAKEWKLNKVFFLSDNEVCIVADKLPSEEELKKKDEEFKTTIDNVISEEIDIGLKPATIRDIRSCVHNPMIMLERKMEEIKRILRGVLPEVPPMMQEKIKEVLEKSEIPIIERGIYCLMLETGDLKWKLDLRKKEKVVFYPVEKYLLIKSYNGKKEITLIDRTNGFPYWKKLAPYEDFQIIFACHINEDIIALWEGNTKLRILDFNTGEEISTYQLDKIEDMFIKKYSLIYSEPDILLSGVRNIRGKIHKAWNWTYIWKFNKDWRLKHRIEEKGLIIATNDLHIIVQYQSKSEEFERYRGPHCDNFQIRVFENGRSK